MQRACTLLKRASSWRCFFYGSRTYSLSLLFCCNATACLSCMKRIAELYMQNKLHPPIPTLNQLLLSISMPIERTAVQTPKVLALKGGIFRPTLLQSQSNCQWARLSMCCFWISQSSLLPIFLRGFKPADGWVNLEWKSSDGMSVEACPVLTLCRLDSGRWRISWMLEEGGPLSSLGVCRIG